MRKGRDGGINGKKMVEKKGKKEKTYENSGHYVIASSWPPNAECWNSARSCLLWFWYCVCLFCCFLFFCVLCFVVFCVFFLFVLLFVLFCFLCFVFCFVVFFVLYLIFYCGMCFVLCFVLICYVMLCYLWFVFLFFLSWSVLTSWIADKIINWLAD